VAPSSRQIRRLLLAAAVAVTASGCATAYRTDVLRKDVRTDAQNAIADTKFDHGDLTVQGSVDRQDTTYDPGQPITLSVTTSKNAYVAILRVFENGDTAIVFPNRANPSAAIAANTVLTVPGPRDAVKITADKPGIVMFEFIASTAGTSWVFTKKPEAGADFVELGVTTRNIATDLRSSLKVGGGPDTAAVHQTVRITGRSLF
jgi:hypothetical protein